MGLPDAIRVPGRHDCREVRSDARRGPTTPTGCSASTSTSPPERRRMALIKRFAAANASSFLAGTAPTVPRAARRTSLRRRCRSPRPPLPSLEDGGRPFRRGARSLPEVQRFISLDTALSRARGSRCSAYPHQDRCGGRRKVVARQRLELDVSISTTCVKESNCSSGPTELQPRCSPPATRRVNWSATSPLKRQRASALDKARPMSAPSRPHRRQGPEREVQGRRASARPRRPSTKRRMHSPTTTADRRLELGGSPPKRSRPVLLLAAHRGIVRPVMYAGVADRHRAARG